MVSRLRRYNTKVEGTTVVSRLRRYESTKVIYSLVIWAFSSDGPFVQILDHVY